MAVESPAYTTLIRDMPQGERPRGLLRGYGAASLLNPELIVILLRTGLEGESVPNMTIRLLFSLGRLSGLSRATFGDMCSQKGINEANARQLQAAFDFVRRLV